nr:hypothetical protein [Tanacetum cinerariifolium]
MELVNEPHKASEFALEDVISTMPDNVITNILDRLHIKDAVKTGILSTDWRFKWTLLTQLVFDENFFKHLPNNIEGKILSRLILHLKGPITKFVLDIPCHEILDVEDIHHWVLFLSRRGIKELTLINRSETQLMLPTQILSCVELKHLDLENCCFRVLPSFHGFPNLLTLKLSSVRVQNYNCVDFIASCPIIENLRIFEDETTGTLKLAEIAKLGNLKMLSLSLCMLDNVEMITSSSIFQLKLLPNLLELDLNFEKCKLLAEASVDEKVPTIFPCLKTLTLYAVNFSSDGMLSFVMEMISGSPNLQNLNITAWYKPNIPRRALPSIDLDYKTMGQLRLQCVVFFHFRDDKGKKKLNDEKEKGKRIMKYNKQKLTEIKELDDLEERINNVEAVLFNLRDIRLKQKDDDVSLDAPVITDSDSSSDSSNDSHDYMSEEEPKPLDTKEKELKPLDVPMQTEEEDPIPLDIVYPHPKSASSSRGTNTRGQTHYGLRSLAPIRKR